MPLAAVTYVADWIEWEDSSLQTVVIKGEFYRV